MTTDDHPTTGGDRVSFVAHDHLIAALDAASVQLGVSRGHYARERIAQILRDEGFLQPDAPASRYEARRRAPPYPPFPPTQEPA